MGTVLIIDDTLGITDLLREALEQEGHTVHAAADGLNGALLFRNQKPDLTFLRIHTRHEGGWDVFSRLKEQDPWARVVVVGGPSEDARKKAAELGGLEYLVVKDDRRLFVEDVRRVARRLLASAAGAAKARKGRILVVDDEQVVRDVLERFLKGKGFEVLTASDGEEALSRVKQDRPHLVLLDMRMPKMDGLEVLKALKGIDHEVAVMMITANNDLTTARRCMEMGAFDYIVKPFQLSYLETTVLAKLLMLTA
ncbi:MAG: response regulator [Elusimicrobia bacterium]|nr:response regulator [Elusimicrobiota bacterium]